MPEPVKQSYDILIITGPTASGKTALAAALADRLNGEIISADSRQVYRSMDIGTGKDYDDYMTGGRRIPCHLIDIADPGYKYNVFEYQRDFLRIYNDLKQRKVFPVLCGGSGMYIDSIVSGYRMFAVPPDPDLRARLEEKSMDELVEILLSYKRLHNQTDTDTKKRAIRAIEIEQYNNSGTRKQTLMPEFKYLIAGVNTDREKRRRRISERLQKRFDAGMIDEVRRLIDRGVSEESLIYYGLEYKYITLYLTGKLDYATMFRELEIAIHQFAKRQMTWFRGMERKGIVINWIDGELPMHEKVRSVLALLER